MRKKRGIGLIVSAVMIVIALLFLSLLYIGNNNANSQSNVNKTTDSSDITQSIENIETADDIETADTIETADDIETTDNIETTNTTTTDSSDIVQSAETEYMEYTFRNQELYDSHFIKHGAEFGAITQIEYLQKANDLIHGENIVTKNDVDGDLIYYSESLNEFLVLSTDGYIRTFFRPDDGIEYFNRQ